jgi:hypothetical protein
VRLDHKDVRTDFGLRGRLDVFDFLFLGYHSIGKVRTLLLGGCFGSL